MAEYTYCPLCAAALGPADAGAGRPLASCGACGFIHYDNPVPVTACLIPVTAGPWEGSRIVLARRDVEPFRGEWCLPGGHVDRLEDPRACCCREVLEETGLVLRLEKLLSACNPSRPARPRNVTALFYLGRIVGGTLKAGSESMEVGVFGADELPKLCFREDWRIIEGWFSGAWGPITGKDL